MTDEISPQALARKQRFIEEKLNAGGFDQLVDQQDSRALRLYFDERGDIMSLTQESQSSVNPLWQTYEFDQHSLSILIDKDTNKFWVVTGKNGKCTVQLRPQATVYTTLKEEDILKIEFDPSASSADCMISIHSDNVTIQLSDKFKESMIGTYPIQATVKGKRIFKFFICDPEQQNVIFDTITVSMVELLTMKQVTKELVADLRHCSIYTTPLFSKYLRT